MKYGKKYLTKIIITICILLFATNVVAENSNSNYSYNFTIDKDLTAISVADFAASTAEGYRAIDDKYLRDSDYLLVNALAYLTRAYSALMITLVTHEFGGHGARARELGGTNISYVFDLDGTGSTSAAFPNGVHIHEDIAYTTGGVQADYILSQKISNRFFMDDNINPTFSAMYIFAKGDQSAYVFSTKGYDRDDPGHDIGDYIHQINSIYGKDYLTASKLKKSIYIDLLDPVLFYSSYSYFLNKDIDVPMLDFGAFEYLPSMHLILAPYGLEYKLTNHLRIDNKYHQVTMNYGKNKNLNSFAFGARLNDIYEIGPVSLGGEFAIWQQPKMFTSKPLEEKEKLGGLIEINSKTKIYENISLLISAGYKTDGFVEGRPLKNSAMIRAGFNFQF